MLVSGKDVVRSIPLDGKGEGKRVQLEHVGALCISGEHVFCACDDVIWKLNRRNLIPHGLFAGGPGVNSLLCSGDGSRLYALCSDADSVLMLSGRTGELMLVNRTGLNPRQMALDGDTLAVAGGESGYVFLLCAKTLNVIKALPMPGPVYSVALEMGWVFALCLLPSLSTVLTAVRKDGEQNNLLLTGMPGRLLRDEHVLLAQTEGMLFTVSKDGGRILKRQPAPGRASWMWDMQDRLLMVDEYSESLFLLGRSGWRKAANDVLFAACDGA